MRVRIPPCPPFDPRGREPVKATEDGRPLPFFCCGTGGGMQEREEAGASKSTQVLERPPAGAVGLAEPEPAAEVHEEVQAMLQQGREPVYDVAILGSGPGGYVAAIRACQLGLK